MREILFRGKTDKGEWVQGDLLHPDIYGNGYSIEDFTKEKNNCFDVIPETIGQYTGLTDKNGTKIFEGDIVKGNEDIFNEDIIFTVIFDEYCRYMIISNYGHYLLARNHENVEVIGNIHDNPELLKECEGK